MISRELATELRDAGLVWHPASGDRFALLPAAIEAEAEAHDEVYTISDMTIEPHHYSSGTVLGFNGTTEWALDSVSLEDALWLPREDQLRELLRGAFVSLDREPGTVGTLYRVRIRFSGGERDFADADAAEAYGRALLALIRAAD